MKQNNSVTPVKESICIVYIITKLELGGAQKVCLSLFQGLKNHEINTYLITGSQGFFVASIQKLPGTIFIQHMIREISSLKLLQEIRTFFQLIHHLRHLKKQYHHNIIVHTHSTKAGILGRWAAFFARIPFRIHTVHGFAFHTRQSNLNFLSIYFIELLTSFITTHFICVSSYDIFIAQLLFPRFKKKYSLIRAAIEDSFFLHTPFVKSTESDHITFGTIACFKPQKNLIDLLYAFKEVHREYPHAKLEIIGDGILKNDIVNWIKKHNLEESIILLGWQEQVQLFLQRWDIFVLSSLWEGLPCALVEARCMKIPIIAYNTGGISDILFHGKNGFLSKKNWKSLAYYMKLLCDHKDLRLKLGAFDDHLTPFSYEYMQKQHKNLYLQLLHKTTTQ